MSLAPAEAQAFLQLANLLPETVLLVSGDGTILAANRCAAAHLGSGARELTGRSLLEIAAGPPEPVERYLRECSRSRQMVLGALSILRGDTRASYRAEGAVYRPRQVDEPALVLLRLIPREASVQRFALLNQRIEELNREIARRKSSEKALRHQEEWLRVTIESIGDAVIATDDEGRVTLMNPTAEELTGWSLEEARGRPLAEIFHIVNEETREPVENPVVKVLALGALQGLANHTVLISKSGHELPIGDCAAPIRDAQGVVRGVVLVFHDVTDRRELEKELVLRAERLAEAGRRKDEFLAMLAHELRSPLAPLRNALYILGMPEAGAELIERSRRMMERQLQNLVRLVDDLLDVSRILHGKVQLHLEEVDLAAVVARAAEAVQPLIEAGGLYLSVSVPPEPLPLLADPTRLEQVLANLLSNAAKFTGPGGAVELSVRRGEDTVTVTVADSGEGIPPDLLPQVFDPFTQGSRSLDRSQGGLGIGLTLVRSLVEMHGGTVTAHSEGLGKGSRFLVHLPFR